MMSSEAAVVVHGCDMERVERALMAWGAWRASGRAVGGYPAVNVLHPSWSPPADGVVRRAPVVSACEAMERRVDGAIAGLSVKLRDALWLVYVKRWPVAQQARALRCKPDTVGVRVRQAKRALAALV